VLALRGGLRGEITLVRPDGYIAYSQHGNDPVEALASVRSVLERQTHSSAGPSPGTRSV
jgi:hypothetical protein